MIFVICVINCYFYYATCLLRVTTEGRDRGDIFKIQKISKIFGFCFHRKKGKSVVVTSETVYCFLLCKGQTKSTHSR